MQFISERSDENEEILCPCRMCLNRIHTRKGLVEDHLYIHGVASTYTRWIDHGEPSDARMNENADHLNEHIGFIEDIGMNEDEDDPDDRIPDMVEELYTAEDQGGGKSMFAAVLEEMKQEIYPGAA
uniref:Transposase-associated domain-containing protein n=1 Tax=Arundo donax TaxID=35708 RepID=A0A0A9DHW4_ARUDO